MTKVDRVYRMGRRSTTTIDRPIVAKFNPYSGKELILSKVRNLMGKTNQRGKHVSVQEKYLCEIQERCKKLYPKLKQLKAAHAASGSKQKLDAHIVKDKLYIGNKATPYKL